MQKREEFPLHACPQASSGQETPSDFNLSLDALLDAHLNAPLDDQKQALLPEEESRAALSGEIHALFAEKRNYRADARRDPSGVLTAITLNTLSDPSAEGHEAGINIDPEELQSAPAVIIGGKEESCAGTCLLLGRTIKRAFPEKDVLVQSPDGARIEIATQAQIQSRVVHVPPDIMAAAVERRREALDCVPVRTEPGKHPAHRAEQRAEALCSCIRAIGAGCIGKMNALSGAHAFFEKQSLFFWGVFLSSALFVVATAIWYSFFLVVLAPPYMLSVLFLLFYSVKRGLDAKRIHAVSFSFVWLAFLAQTALDLLFSEKLLGLFQGLFQLFLLLLYGWLSLLALSAMQRKTVTYLQKSLFLGALLCLNLGHLLLVLLLPSSLVLLFRTPFSAYFPFLLAYLFFLFLNVSTRRYNRCSSSGLFGFLRVQMDGLLLTCYLALSFLSSLLVTESGYVSRIQRAPFNRAYFNQ